MWEEIRIKVDRHYYWKEQNGKCFCKPPHVVVSFNLSNENAEKHYLKGIPQLEMISKQVRLCYHGDQSHQIALCCAAVLDESSSCCTVVESTANKAKYYTY